MPRFAQSVHLPQPLQPLFVAGRLAAFAREVAFSGTPAVALGSHRAWMGLVALGWFAARPESPSAPWAENLWAALPAAACLVFGVFPRASAGLLFALSSSTIGAGGASDLGDYCVSISLFWLALLPSGEAVSLPRWLAARRGVAASEAPGLRCVEGLTTRLFLIQVSLIYLNVSVWRGTLPQWQSGSPTEVALCLVPSLYLMPPQHPARWLAPLTQLAVHLWLLSTRGDAFVHLCLMASALLFERRRFAAASTRSARFRAGVAGGLASTYTLLVLVLIAGQLGDHGSIVSRSARLLQSAGLMPGFLLIGGRG